MTMIEAQEIREAPPPPILSLYEEALKFANSIRKDYGLPEVDRLSKGSPNLANYCPLAKSLRPLFATVFHDELEVEDDWGEVGFYIPPPNVSLFIENFDRGAYPELMT